MVQDKNKSDTGKRVSLVILFLISVAIFFVSHRLREYKYAEVPLPGETRDEYSFGWLGISLLNDHYPTAWSGIAGYKNQSNQKINVDRLFDLYPESPAFPINKPWFDHPPAFGLIVGGYAYIHGVRNFEDASVIILRRPMIKLGAVAAVLVFLLAYEIFGIYPALFSGTVFAASPLVTISSRLALAENGYVPLFLLSVYILIKYIQSRSKILLALLLLFSSVSVLFKISAVSIPISLGILSYYFAGENKMRVTFGLFSAALIGLIVFAGYGYYFDWNTFKAILISNSNRFYGVGAEIFYNAFAQTKVTGTKFLTDGWILAGWISFFVILFRISSKDKAMFIVVPILVSLLMLILLGSEAYGWYRFPILPFLVICLGKVLYELVIGGNVLFFLLILLPFGTFIHRLIGVEGFQQYVTPFRLGMLGVFMLSLYILPSNVPFLMKALRVIMIIVFIFTIFLSVKLIYYYTPGNWIFAT